MRSTFKLNTLYNYIHIHATNSLPKLETTEKYPYILISIFYDPTTTNSTAITTIQR